VAILLPPFRSWRTVTPSSVSALPGRLVIPRSWRVRRGVDVLPLDQAVLEGKDVDSVPFDDAPVPLRLGRPLADDQPVGRVEAAGREGEGRGVPENPRDVVTGVGGVDAFVRGPVVEDEIGSVQRDDVVDVLSVPGVVVALDQTAQRLGVIAHGCRSYGG